MKKTTKPGMFLNAKRSVFLKAKFLRKNMTMAEKMLWNELKSKKLKEIKFRRQHPILFFILDFYCHQYQLGIELDGENHLSTKQREYDNYRTQILSKFGVKILRFRNDEVIDDLDSIISTIINTIENKKENSPPAPITP
jgi:very-short-patch-repair endonuclease